MGAAVNRDRLLSVTDVAEITDMGEGFARELMKRLGAVLCGRRGIVKLQESKLREWMAAGGDAGWLRYIDEDERGGHGATTGTANDGAEAPSKPTRTRRELSQHRLSKNSRWTPISPGTKPARSL